MSWRNKFTGRIRQGILWTIPIFCGVTLLGYKSYSSPNTLDTHMTPDQKRATGLHKLSEQERKELQKWINENHTLKPGAKKIKRPHISEVIGNGAYVKLSDDSIWLIHPDDRLITQSWLTPVEILVERSPNAQYPYTLTNTLTKSEVRAAPVRKIPKAEEPRLPQEEMQQPGKPSSQARKKSSNR